MEEAVGDASLGTRLILKNILNRFCASGLDSPGSKEGPCEYNDESSGSIKDGEITSPAE